MSYGQKHEPQVRVKVEFPKMTGPLAALLRGWYGEKYSAAKTIYDWNRIAEERIHQARQDVESVKELFELIKKAKKETEKDA